MALPGFPCLPQSCAGAGPLTKGTEQVWAGKAAACLVRHLWASASSLREGLVLCSNRTEKCESMVSIKLYKMYFSGMQVLAFTFVS